MDTIFALATAPGKAGVAVIRVSGPDADAACRALAGDLPKPRYAALRLLRDAEGAVLDQALVLRFEGRASFTAEPVCEFHLHGSAAVVRSVQARLATLPGLRPAEAGEFTRRALVNGALDLTQVEALGDLIEAETERQRQQALSGFSGALAKRADGWRDRIVEGLALVEVTIDFADEDVPVDVTPDVRRLWGEVLAAIDAELTGLAAAERVRDGFEVAIVGAPNAGKSTLLNRLAGRDAAITSDIAGTTRDVIEVSMDIGGLAVTFLDTAGLRDSTDPVEQIGVSRARERAEAADLRLHLVQRGEATILDPQPGDLIVTAKDDEGTAPLGVSGKTGAGITELLEQIAAVLEDRVSNAALANRERHRIALMAARDSLGNGIALLDHGPGSYDIASEDIRFAAHKLQALVGRVDVEDVLDHIFAQFCIGK